MITKLFRIVCLLLVLLCSTALLAQERIYKWSVSAGYEVNFMGNNATLHVQNFRKDKHLLEGGLSYNISDGFADRPVIGIDLGYGYKLLHKPKWKMYTGVDYRLQRPITIVNIQTITCTNMVCYSPIPRVLASARIGYGVATSRARSAGAFTQTNSPTGSFQLLCGFLF